MKDTSISPYDHMHHHHHQQQQHQQHPHQHQHHSWNQIRQQQQQHHQHNHNSSAYSNQSNNHQNAPSSYQQTHQRSAINHQQQQQQQQQLNQYHHHQPIQSTTASANYYQQAHLYSSYQPHNQAQDQPPQQSTPSTDIHHQISGSSVPVTTSSASTNTVTSSVIVPPQQQQQSQQSQTQQQHHNQLHHQQTPANSQASNLTHSGWNPTSIGHQSHHSVVTDHSTLAYMTHAYQGHGASICDHRTPNAPMAAQPVGSNQQTSSYTVDSLYSSPAAAAAVAAAAYGYDNYNAAFFQTTNNTPHSQNAHPSQANISAFWNHNQPSQNRAAHSQAVNNQVTIPQRQSMASDQTANYLHDPRMYYGRSAYEQHGIQDFSQTQQHVGQPSQTEILHQRMTALSQQQHQLLPHHDQQLHQISAHQPVHQQSSLINQHQSLNNQSILGSHHLPTDSQPSTDPAEVPSATNSRQPHSGKPAAQPSALKQPTDDTDIISKTTDQVKGQLISNRVESEQLDKSNLNKQDKGSQDRLSLPQSKILKSQESKLNHEPAVPPVPALSATASVTKGSPTQPVRNETQYQRKVQPSNSVQSNRQLQRDQEDRLKVTDPFRKPVEREIRNNNNDARRPLPLLTQTNKPAATLDEGIASLSLGGPARKTTWASIASKPAQVSQPKSLKSKITGSTSVLSSAKHLAAVSLDVSNIESKNGINPAIKSSVSAATSLQRSSVPPPVSKLPAAVASLKLDLLGEESLESSRISWPAVNASIKLTLDDPPLKDNSHKDLTKSSSQDEKHEDQAILRDQRDYPRDHNHNHNQGPGFKPGPPYQSNRDHWGRRDYHDGRGRRDTDREDLENDRIISDRDLRDSNRRDMKNTAPRNNHRGDESYRERDFKHSAMLDRSDFRNNDGYQISRFTNNRYTPRNYERTMQPTASTLQESQSQHHHYNNVRDGNAAPQKLDLSMHPHLDPSNYNPKTFNLEPVDARFFIIKSYSEDDIHRSIKYSIWCSTNHGNKRLDEAYRQQQTKNGPIYLFFSVNGSGHFCGMAQMTSMVDFDSSSGVWAQSKWQGEFSVRWIYVKDVPNGVLRHITLENNEDKPVTNSRDTQEVPSEKGKAVLKILHQYSHTTSLFDDFLHYERRQEESKFKKSHLDQMSRTEERDRGGPGGIVRSGRPYVNARPHNDLPSNRERSSRFAS